MKANLLLAGIAISLTITSCKKDEPVPSPNPVPEPTGETFNSLQEYLGSKDVESQFFNFTAENGTTFTANKGSVVTIPANALIDQVGNPVTGAVTAEFKEVFSNSDIMFSRIFPRTFGGNMLNSGGEYKLEITQNGNVLRVAPGQMIDVVIPAQAPNQGMLLFFANEQQLLDSANIGWGDPVDSTFTASGFSFNSTDNTYELFTDSLGWSNIDGFMSSVTYFDIDFELTGVNGVNETNTTGFAVFKNENAVWPLNEVGFSTFTNNVISETHLADVPMNVVIISVVGGQLYYGLLDVTPVQGTSYTIPLQATTSANLDAIILGLE